MLAHTDLDAAQTTLQRLRTKVVENASANGRPYCISYSVGEALCDPDANIAFTELVRQADALMYQRKPLKKQKPVQ